MSRLLLAALTASVLAFTTGLAQAHRGHGGHHGHHGGHAGHHGGSYGAWYLLR